MPARDAPALGFSNPGLPRTPVEVLQDRARVIALVGHALSRVVRRGRCTHARQVAPRRVQGAGDGGGVAFVSRMHLGCHHRPSVQIDGVFGLVGQVGCAVLHARDPRLGIGPRHPLLVRQPLARTLPVQADEVLRCRCLDPALLGHPLQHLPIARAGVAAHDLAQGRVGFQGRGIHADPFTPHQPAFGDQGQNPAEDALVHLMGQTAPRLRQPGMVRNPVGGLQPQKLTQGQ